MEFKGTKGKWVLNKKYQTIEDSEGYGIAQQNGIKNSEKWLNDALLISKAPEMLEMLQSLENDDNAIPAIIWNKIQKLIKEATDI